MLAQRCGLVEVSVTIVVFTIAITVLVLLSFAATVVVAVLAMLPPFETEIDARVLFDEAVTTLVVSLTSEALSIALVAVAVLEILVNTVLVIAAVRAAIMPSVDVLLDADSVVVVAPVTVVDVMRLRDVDKLSVPPPSPSWSRDVCPVCLVLVLLSVTATEVVVLLLTILPSFETAGDVRVLLDEAVATPVVSVVLDAFSIAAAVVAVLEILVNAVLATSRVRLTVVP